MMLPWLNLVWVVLGVVLLVGHRLGFGGLVRLMIGRVVVMSQ
jgi:hypothetical protein